MDLHARAWRQLAAFGHPAGLIVYQKKGGRTGRGPTANKRQTNSQTGFSLIAAERCNVPVEKCHMIMQKYGYTGSACIPMALDDAIELGKIKRGDLVVMIQSGLGWNQAAAAIRMTT